MKATWSEVTIGEVCDIQSGAGFPLKHQGVTEGDFPFFKVGDMNTPGNEVYLIETPNHISEDVRKTIGAKVLPPESVVFPKVGGAIATNKKRKISIPSCVDNNIMGLVPKKEKITSHFLAWWMQSVDIYEFSNKANPPSITQATVSDWPIQLPPLDEQKRIVAVLDKAFVALDRARTLAELNLADTEELFERALDRALVINVDGWILKPLRELGKIQTGSTPKTSNQLNFGEAIPFIKPGDFRTDGSLNYKNQGLSELGSGLID